jgi:hypothetical protein
MEEDMFDETSQNIRTLLAILAGLIGLFLIAVAPDMVQTSLERVLESLLEVIQDRPQFESGITLFSFFYPFWRAVGFVAGATLLVISPAIYRGEGWTPAVALVAYAVPSISGMFMFLPYISWVEGFPLPMVISWVGLLGFWTMLLLRKSERAEKAVDFLVYTFMGMLATHSFTLGIGSLRMLNTRPEKPLFAGLEWWLLTVVGEVDWIATAMLIAAIPLLALRKRAGWWLALIAGVSILLIDAYTQIVRTRTLDYLYGALLAFGLVLFLLIPGFKRRLLREGTDPPTAR